MRPKAVSVLLVWAAVWGSLAVQVHAQDSPALQQPPSVTSESQSASDDAAAASNAASEKIRFNFKGATFQQVIEFFSRSTGLPVIWQAQPPEGTLDYLSPEAYDQAEALRVLNIILQSKGVMLRVSEQMLYLQTLQDMQKSDIPTFVGKLPEEVTSDQIITVVRPLKIALAKPMAERLAAMVAQYGAVTAMEQQNALVITETAANVRRLLTIIDQLDMSDPDGAVEIFPIKHARASELMTPLRALLSTKVEKYVVNEKGQQVKIEDTEMPGLAITADDRTNAIISKGSQNRIDQLRDAINLLDVPAAGNARTMRTRQLHRITPAEAAAKLNQLYQKLDNNQRPTVLTLDDAMKVAIVGDEAAVAEGFLLLRELDGDAAGAAAATDAEPVMAVINLQRANSNEVLRAISSLLNKRQQMSMKLVAGLDGRSIIVAGPAGDVDAVRSLVPVLDRQGPADRQVRLLRLASGDPRAIIRQARRMFDEQRTNDDDEQMELTCELDSSSRVVTMIGSQRALDAFTDIVQQIESNIVIDREARTFELANVLPSEIISPLTSLANQLLRPTDGSQFIPPTFTAVDQLNMLVVTATPEQLAMLESVIGNLDASRAEGTTPPLRLLQLRIADAGNLANVIMRQYNQRPPAERKAKPVNVAADHSTNSLILSVHPDVMPEIQAIVDELNKTERTDLEGREIRIFPLKVARAEELAKTIDEMFPQPPPPVDIRGRPQPHLQKPREVVVRADPQTNSLIVDAPIQRMAGFEQLVEQLDRQQFVEETQVRTYAVVHADLNALANTLRQLAASRALLPEGQDQRVPITITVEPMSQTLIVAGPVNIFERVDQVMKELDVKRSGPATTLRIFKLSNARADAIADMLRDVLTTRIRQDVDVPGGAVNMQSLLNISADRKSNTLIISAPEAVMPVAEQVIRQLDDSVSSLGDPVVRVRPVRYANAASLSATLNAALVGVISKATGEPMSVKLVPAPDASAILMVGLEPDLAEVEQLIEPLDTAGAGSDQTQVRLVKLKHARAETVAPLVQQLLAGEEIPLWLRYDALARNRQLPETGPQVRVAAEPRLNAVVISAPPAVLDIAEEMAAQLDVDPAQLDGGATARTVRVLTVRNADARQLATNLEALFSDADQSEVRPTIRVDAVSNSLIVRATDEQFDTIEQVVSRIDKASITATRQMRMIPIDPSRAKAQDIASALQQLTQSADDSAGPKVQVITLEELLNRKKEKRESESKPQVKDETEQRKDASTVSASHHLPLAAKPAYIAPSIFTNFAAIVFATGQDDEQTDQGGHDDNGSGDEPDVTIAVDPATNSLILLGSQRAIDRLSALARQIQDQLPAAPASIRYITLPQDVDVQGLATLLSQTLQHIPNLPGQRGGPLRQRVGIIADPVGNALIIASNDTDFETVGELIAALSKPTATEFPIRTMTLHRAEASAVARAIQQFYDDRARVLASHRGRRQQGRRISIMGIDSSNTLLVSASDEDFKQVEQLVEQFDTAEAVAGLTFRIFQLRHANAGEIERNVQLLVNDLIWNQGQNVFFWPPRNAGQQQGRRDMIAVRADARLNALIVTGQGDKFDVVEKLIEELDAPPREGDEKVIRLYRTAHVQLQTVADVVRETFNAGRQRRFWEPPDPTEIRVRVDDANHVLIVSATAREQEEIAQLIAGLDKQAQTVGMGGEMQTQVLPVKFGRAVELAGTLTRFLNDRARKANAARPAATIIPSESANTLIVAAPADEMATIRDLLTQLDLPDVTGDRVIEIIALQQGSAQEIGRIVREQFSRRTGAGGQGVVITPDARTNSVIVNAPQLEFEQVRALIDRLDSPSASDETIIRTYAIKGARADEAVRILTDTLQLDPRGRTPGKGITIKLDESDSEAVEVKARIVADRRSNSLIVTATEQSFPIIESLISKLEEVPAASPVEWRIVTLKHALASEVRLTLDQITRGLIVDNQSRPRIDYNRLENQLIISATADQFKQIEEILQQIDVPSQHERLTDFVPLRFANADKIREALSVFYGPWAVEADTPGKRNVRIVSDPATNSLVITANKDEWQGIRSLLEKLDSEEYDASLQLKVLPLMHADAQSVARAINEAFQGQVTGDSRTPGAANRSQQSRSRSDADRRSEIDVPTVLVQSEDWVRASAEPLTNSVIVSASRQNIAKIEQIVQNLDVADYAKLPPPQIIPVTSGDPVQLAQSLTQLYEQAGRSGAARSGAARKSLRIVGDAASNSIIVRAEVEDFQQIRTLAEALQQQAASQGLTVNVVKLNAAPASRVASAITEAFQAKARQANQPLSIRVDATGNSLVIASSAPLLEEIKTTVAELDALSPAAGQGIFIIELENIPPETAKNIIETIGLDKPQPADSVSRIVTEPVKVSVLAGRNAVVVVANPVDREAIVSLLKAVDAEPALAEAQTKVIRLKHAQAQALSQILAQVLRPGNQQADTPLARSAREHVRRLTIRRDRPDDGSLQLDLTSPIRIVADPALNALVISSTHENLAVMEQLIAMFDQLPITDAVMVQLFPLQNISAEQFSRIVRELFAQGKQLGRTAITKVAGMPDGAAGKALLEELAITTDERTNTVIVAGSENAVALVEVMVKRLDSNVAIGWIEPRVLPLRFADATDLAATLQAIVVDGVGNLPQSTPLQRQIGRLRMARLNENGGQVLESTVFVPMTRLVIRPEPQMNALILVGTPENLEVVSELVAMLDVETASPQSTVRIYPIEHASAARLAQTVRQLFDQQVRSRAIREEDRVVVQADERTNALIVATSPRSFAVLEGLLKTLDAELAPDLREIRTIELKNASAQRLASLLQQMMDSRLERLRRVQPETADLERATIVADARTNSLVIAAGNDTFEVIRRVAADLDQNVLGDVSLVHVLPLEKGNGERIAQAINQIMERRYADMPAELRNSQRPLVMTDARTNSLLVAANPEDLASIEDLVNKLAAAPTNPAVGVHVVALGSSVRAELIAPRLQRLMRERQATLGQAATPTDRVAIEPDLASNSLIVAASNENLDVIRNLIDALTKTEMAQGDDGEHAGAPGRELEMVMLSPASRAADMVDLLGELYVQEANRTRGQNTVRVTADERVNAVLINAPANDVRALRALIAQLDGAKPANVIEIKYVPLQSANALETVSLIENVLSGRGIGPRRNTRQATVLKYLREIARSQGEEMSDEASEDAGVEMQVSAAIRESITLTPDLRTNTIIVSAPRESARMIEQMIRDLDASNTGSKSIRIFKLENADAVAMAELLTDLFNLRQGNSLFVLKPREDVPGIAGGGGLELDGANALAAAASSLGSTASFAGTELTAVPDERQQLAITIDSRTNSLIVSGTPKYLDLVAKVVDELDRLEANEREVFVYQLRNSVAADVARVISEFVDQEQQKLISTLSVDQIGSAARLLEREVTISGDQQSNSVLVSASPRYMNRVKELIRQLDVDPPQVLIQVMLAEVTLDSRDEWGVDFFARAEINGTDVVGSYGLASAFVHGLGVPNLAIASSDFELLIRAMKSQGRLQVLSNPSIMAANNAPARIQVGETIRLPVATSITDAGRIQSSLEKEDIGVILKVTPTINPDGFVRMTITPEISSLSARTTQISEDFESPIIIRRTADTTVTVQDGQTIVLGGLISDRFERRDQKVPFFGDLPLVGPLFRSNTEETAKTELLIVLTPHVIESPAQFDRIDQITDREIDRLSVPPEVKESIRRNLIDGTGALYDAEGNRIEVQIEQ